MLLFITALRICTCMEHTETQRHSLFPGNWGAIIMLAFQYFFFIAWMHQIWCDPCKLDYYFPFRNSVEEGTVSLMMYSFSLSSLNIYLNKHSAAFSQWCQQPSVTEGLHQSHWLTSPQCVSHGRAETKWWIAVDMAGMEVLTFGEKLHLVPAWCFGFQLQLSGAFTERAVVDNGNGCSLCSNENSAAVALMLWLNTGQW